jgi:hypothetical protein
MSWTGDCRGATLPQNYTLLRPNIVMPLSEGIYTFRSLRFRSDNIFMYLNSLACVFFRNIRRGSTYAQHKCHGLFLTFIRTPIRILQMIVRFVTFLSFKWIQHCQGSMGSHVPPSFLSLILLNASGTIRSSSGMWFLSLPYHNTYQNLYNYKRLKFTHVR